MRLNSKTPIALSLALLAAPHAFAAADHDQKATNINGKPMSVEDKVPVVNKDIVDTAMSSKDHATLVKLVKEAALVDMLKGPGPYTVFAPTDAAFKKLPKKELDALMKDKTKLKSLLSYHVVPSALPLAELSKMTSATSAQGGSFDVKVEGKKVWVGKALVTKADMLASNGVVHSIDHVMMPPMN